jgi:putative transposase
METTKQTYPSDLTDGEWELIMPYLPPNRKRGRRRQFDGRLLLNAMFYIGRTGNQWRYLPNDYPAWQTVYYHFAALVRAEVWQTLNQVLSEQVRLNEGRNAQPSAALLDSQSVKASETSCYHGYDGGKKVKGAKRHILVDTLGLLIVALVHDASLADRDGAIELLDKAALLPQCKLLKHFWTDGAYNGEPLEDLATEYGWTLEMVKPPPDQKGFQVLPRRWVVERTFAWFGHFRRLAKNYERKSAVAEAFIYLSMCHLLLARLA